MEELIEIEGDEVRLYLDDVEARRLDRRVAVDHFVDEIARLAREVRGERTPLLAPGVLYFEQRGPKTVVVVQQPPQVRRVRWIADPDSTTAAEEYRERALAFPYVVIVLSFDGASLDGRGQLYYRAEPLNSLEDELLQPNLLNVTQGNDTPHCWLCLGRLEMGSLSWSDRIARSLEFLWQSGFNYDFEVPRGSCFTRARDLDPRIATVEAWERTSREHPLFPLEIPWPATGVTLAGAVAASLQGATRLTLPRSGQDLADLLYRLPEVEAPHPLAPSAAGGGGGEAGGEA